MEHHHTILGWLNHNSGVIILVWFPAFCGYLNAFVAAFKVMGWTKLADELGKIEDALKAFVDALKAQYTGNPGKTGGTA